MDLCEKNEIGKRIRAERKVWGLTQQQLAEKLCEILGEDDVSIQRISAYERGDNLPTVRVILAFAEAFHVTTDYLLCRSNSKNPEAAEVVSYTGLTEEAAGVLHRLHEVDMATDSLGTSLAAKRDAKKPPHINQCDIISDFIKVGLTCFTDMHLLKRLSLDMQREYKPKKVFPDKESDSELKFQSSTRRQVNKYFGPSDIVSGKELLIYRARRISDRLQRVVFQICDLPQALEFCEKIDAQRRKKEYGLIQEWGRERKNSDKEGQ